MNRKWIALLFPLVLASCATTYLWDHTESYVVVPQNRVCEADLRARHIKYIRSDVSGVFFVERSGVEKCENYAIRILAAPVTIAVDATTGILVVGGGFYIATQAKDGGDGAIDYVTHVLDSITEKIERMQTQPPPAKNVP